MPHARVSSNHAAPSLGLFLLCAGTATASAPSNNTPGASETYNRCFGKVEGSSTGIAHCQTAELKRQNTDLDAAFKALLRRLPAAHRATLQNSEQNWLKRRDAKCAVADKDKSNPDSALNAQECKITETAARTLILRSGHG